MELHAIKKTAPTWRRSIVKKSWWLENIVVTSNIHLSVSTTLDLDGRVTLRFKKLLLIIAAHHDWRRENMHWKCRGLKTVKLLRMKGGGGILWITFYHFLYWYRLSRIEVLALPVLQHIKLLLGLFNNKKQFIFYKQDIVYNWTKVAVLLLIGLGGDKHGFIPFPTLLVGKWSQLGSTVNSIQPIVHPSYTYPGIISL